MTTQTEKADRFRLTVRVFQRFGFTAPAFTFSRLRDRWGGRSIPAYYSLSKHGRIAGFVTAYDRGLNRTTVERFEKKEPDEHRSIRRAWSVDLGMNYEAGGRSPPSSAGGLMTLFSGPKLRNGGYGK